MSECIIKDNKRYIFPECLRDPEFSDITDNPPYSFDVIDLEDQIPKDSNMVLVIHPDFEYKKNGELTGQFPKGKLLEKDSDSNQDKMKVEINDEVHTFHITWLKGESKVINSEPEEVFKEEIQKEGYELKGVDY